MSLPAAFESSEQYFEECIQFFREYQVLYNFANTEVLVRNVLDNIIVQNIDEIDVFSENLNLQESNEEYLKKFFDKINRLRAIHKDFVEDRNMEDIFDVPLSPKKRHEIIYLAKEIKEVCQAVGCDTVVDFGSGLGYLDQLVFETASYQVLGLECNESHYVGAKKRQRKYHDNSIDKVKYIKHTVTQDSVANIKEYLEDKFQNVDGFCITGLHACADLAIDAMNIFLRMREAKCLIVSPCCYHKMAVSEGSFKNFPVSRCLKDYFDQYGGSEFMKVPFLRLGAQPPSVAETLENAVFNLLARAVLEQYAAKHNCRLKRNKRKAVKTKLMNNDFENYIADAASHGFTLLKNNSDNTENIEFDLTELRSLWDQIDEKTKKKAGIFILLQNNLQPVIENLILYDRVVYMRENSVTCKFKKIFNDVLSPRSLALIAICPYQTTELHEESYVQQWIQALNKLI